jgi:IS30 family transposase
MTIASLRQARSGVRAIVNALGRSPGTINRVLARNVGGDGSYASLPAQALNRSRRVPGLKIRACMSRTNASTRLSMHIPSVSCAVISSPACATVAAHACLASAL